MGPLKTCLSSALTIVVLFSLFDTGDSLVCYSCNSKYDPRCADPLDDYSLGTKNCTMLVPPVPDARYTICRKMTQKVYGEVRVWRGCGYITDSRDDKECVKRSGTHDVQVLYCSCTSDLCNGSGLAVPGLQSLLPSLMLAAAAAFGALQRHA